MLVCNGHASSLLRYVFDGFSSVVQEMRKKRMKDFDIKKRPELQAARYKNLI